ncbi:hypothetical protein [Carboxylicivirga sp. N1Y90]|uniref:hypothetical protein n=1 Tax=Carboxylicivirga fragile TaxID=3417571 RepID=UPI003D33E568|nr:hypothetical protein [Marinilabiliaceae bacterium N1Y90]
MHNNIVSPSQTKVIHDLATFDEHFQRKDPKGNIYYEIKNAVIDCEIPYEHFQNILFLRCTSTIFSSQFVVDFKSTNSISFNTVEFIERLSIRGTLKENSAFRTVTFHQASSISRLTCLKRFDFQNITINKRVEFFIENQFVGEATFSNLTKVNGNEGLFFYDTTFKDKVYFRNIDDQYLSLNSCKFESILSLSFVHLRELLLSATIFNSTIEKNQVSFGQGSREVFRQLKHQMLINNNKIDALEFHKLEMNAFRTEIEKRKWYNPDKLILFLNSISNSHGTNPWVGIAFVLGVSIIGFFPQLLALRDSYFEWGWHGFERQLLAIGTTIKLWVNFINPAHSINFLDEYNPRAITYVWDNLWRIFIGYGYYQTIQGFRKYGRL